MNKCLTEARKQKKTKRTNSGDSATSFMEKAKAGTMKKKMSVYWATNEKHIDLRFSHRITFQALCKKH